MPVSFENSQPSLTSEIAGPVLRKSANPGHKGHENLPRTSFCTIFERDMTQTFSGQPNDVWSRGRSMAEVRVRELLVCQGVHGFAKNAGREPLSSSHLFV